MLLISVDPFFSSQKSFLSHNGNRARIQFENHTDPCHKKRHRLNNGMRDRTMDLQLSWKLNQSFSIKEPKNRFHLVLH